jgi:hypothetical protein
LELFVKNDVIDKYKKRVSESSAGINDNKKMSVLISA